MNSNLDYLYHERCMVADYATPFSKIQSNALNLKRSNSRLAFNRLS
jgi:hypothetical protein